MLRVPLRIQVGAVVVLFVAALATLWTTSTSVVNRERRRISAGNVLARAGEALSRQGRTVLGSAPRWPYELSPEEWDALDRRLAEESRRVLARFDGVEGGYFLRDHKRFLGSTFPTEPRSTRLGRPGIRKGPPPREADLIEIQSDAAIRRNQAFFVVLDVPPSTVAIRTAPVIVDGRVVAATWTMTRLIDPLFLDRSLRGYQISAGLALGGVALALALTFGLSRTVARQRVERDRLQVELRRSERLAALGKLLAGVAHEVRNPLAGIRSTVQLWQRGIGRDEESYEGLLAEVDRLDGIVGRLLHFSRADAQEMIPGDLNALVAESARLAEGPALAVGVRIETSLAASLPPIPMAAPAVLQILRNLTTNAIQSMPEGGLLKVSTRLAPSEGLVEVEVADTGPGLARDVLEHLFEPFFTTKPDGTGLGLAIAREIALAHRGDLKAGPRAIGPGAVFTLALPLG
ncbi:two-component system sensor histidine kinase NtrB [Tundrisphaera lichenicola]|uniref:two-component system sensor histidine kinase NtrB n=1 Tax=Tundrisphaera lichenicola TaxID=2029860 RepID=UPI003EBCEE16